MSTPMPEDSKAHNLIVYKDCRYRPETLWTKFMWVLFGVLVGSVLGWLISQAQIRSENDRVRISKTHCWITSVVREIEDNIEQGTDSPVFNTKGDSIAVKTHLKYSALESFLNLLPELGIPIQEIEEKGRLLLNSIISTNQVIDQRNIANNEILIAESERKLRNLIKGRVTEVARIDGAINKMLRVIGEAGEEYKEMLIRIRADL